MQIKKEERDTQRGYGYSREKEERGGLKIERRKNIEIEKRKERAET